MPPVETRYGAHDGQPETTAAAVSGANHLRLAELAAARELLAVIRALPMLTSADNGRFR